jgi:D-sedoheptulose 7-phosphate isomerase
VPWLDDEIRAELAESSGVLGGFSPELIARIAQFAEKAAQTLRAGGKLVFFGNGGSAAQAEHFAAELVVRLRRDRPGLAAFALASNPAIVTAAANDYGFEAVFARQIEALVLPADLVVALTTSGQSLNVVGGLEAAKKRGACSVALTGRAGGKAAGLADLLLNVPADNPQRIQEAHLAIGHIACSLIERLVSPPASRRARRPGRRVGSP